MLNRASECGRGRCCPGHELRRRHVLQRGVGEDLTGHLRLRQLIEERILDGGIHLEGVAETHLLLAHTGVLREGLIQELGGEHGVGGGDGVVGRQVVVLTGVDDDARIAVDDAGEVLVDDRALQVDGRGTECRREHRSA